jgi:heme/copper-type cytochrome/quinol oxidase subunit 3
MTGLICIIVTHMKGPALSKTISAQAIIITLGGLFVMILCMEYLHLFTVISGSAMLFFVVTGLHGSHVIMGLIAMMILAMKGFQESTLHSSTDTTHLGGCLGLYLY